MSKKSSTFAVAKVLKIMRTNPNIVESPVMEAAHQGGQKEYLTADELMQRLEPHIRSLFR